MLHAPNYKLHPLTGVLLAPVGYRRDGRPIWPVLGGSEPAGAPAPGGDGGAPPAGAPDGGGQPAPEGQPPAQPEAGDNLPDDPAALKAEIARLRRENGSERTKAKATAAEQARAEMAQQIAKALGLAPNDETPDPAKLTEQLTATQQQARQAAVELAVYRAAGKHSGDPDALLDSRTFLAKVGDLDPTAADFGAAVDQAIRETVEANPKLKAGRAPGASGADHTGGSGEHAATFRKPASMHDAVAQSYGT